MALDFPSAPAVGQLYPVTPIAGVPQYRWNGSGWVAVQIPVPPGGVFDAGTVMLFYQATAPTGWTKQTTHNDKALRVVSGVGGASGGTNPFSTVMAQSVVGNHTQTLGETPAGITAAWNSNIVVYPGGSSTIFLAGINGNTWYQLGMASSASVGVPPGYNLAYTPSGAAPTGYSAIQGNNSATATSNNTGGGAHNHPITMGIQYLDMILASKDP